MTELIHSGYLPQEGNTEAISFQPSQEVPNVTQILIHPEGAHRIGRALQSKFATIEPSIRSGLSALANDPSVTVNERQVTYIAKVCEQWNRLSSFVNEMQTAEHVGIETDGHYERIIFPTATPYPETPSVQNTPPTADIIRLVASTVAHEGKTPSTSIKGYLELLKRRGSSPTIQEEITRIVTVIDAFSGGVSEISKEIELESMTASFSEPFNTTNPSVSEQ